MGNKKVSYTDDGTGKPIHKMKLVDGIKSSHNAMLSKHKKRKLRKKKKSR